MSCPALYRYQITVVLHSGRRLTVHGLFASSCAAIDALTDQYFDAARIVPRRLP